MKSNTQYILPLIFVSALIISCSRQADPVAPDVNYVQAVSSGILGRTEPILVEFVHAQDTQAPLASNVFTLHPSARGTLSWLDEFTLAFTPSEPLRGGRRYQARVNLTGIPAFTFDFSVSLPMLAVALEPVMLDANGDAVVRGSVTVDPGTEIAHIEATITSSELGRPRWTHEFGRHIFTFAPITLQAAARTVAVNWNGRSLGSAENGFTSVLIPGTEAFEITGFHMNAGVLEVSFSAPLRANSDLRGFITMDGNTNIRYQIERNIVRVFGDGTGGIPPGTEIIIQDVADINGRVLAVPVQHRIPERWELPQVRFAGTGNILPTTQGSQLVIETRNISGVLVEAFRIHGNNMLQFLQVNNLSGDRELDRVGEPVWTSAIDFGWSPMDQNRWVRRGLDLSELSRRYPDSMFRIRVSFRQRHIHFECTAEHGSFANLTFPDDSFPTVLPWDARQPSFWDNFHRMPGFNWSDWHRFRRDPCHPSFFFSHWDHDITIGRNVLVSDLGLMAKRDMEGSWLIVTTNIVTAQPARGVDFRIHNFQGRVLAQGRTGADGIAFLPHFTVTPQDNRFFISAESDLGRAYLRVQDALALATSHFDVAGGPPSTGIRGLIYGERGVWRPGDDIFLTFLLSDPQQTLPPNHPVTLEFEDPRGRLVVQQTHTSSVDGFFRMAVSTAPDAPTGNWTARVRVGGNVFTRLVRVETVMPNRLGMNLDFGMEDMIRSGPRQVRLGAEWLFGAPAPGLRADVSVAFSDRETTFPAFGDFSFRDPSRSVSTERANVWEGSLDATGQAAFTMQLNPGARVPGMVTARFLTRVFEPSGMFSSEQISIDYSPYERYVGLRLPALSTGQGSLAMDTDHTAEIVLLSEDGVLVPGQVRLNAAIYRLDWRWWWERGREEPAQFAASLSRNPVSRAEITAVNGRATWNFRINEPNWGRHLVIIRDNDGGHAAAQIVHFGWPWRTQDGDHDSQAMLTLTPGRPSYNVGERISVSFPSNRYARALVTVEKGGQILRSEWINGQDGITTYEFPADPDMVPNVYVHVTMIQPHLQTQNDLPIRLYGITPVMVADPRTVLSPQISAPEVWESESTVSFTVSEATGRPMAYTVAVVDEGLLGLTRFTLPNPHHAFYAREASFLRYWDIYRDVIGAHSGMLETLLAIGGGDVEDHMDDGRDVQRFRPVVMFFGPYELGPNEQRTKTFDLPPYIGALRIMVMAASSTAEVQAMPSQRAYGTAEQTVRVTSDLMVFATLPRVLSPADEVVIPVHVNSYAAGNRTVRVNLSVPGAEIQGQSFQNVVFDAPGERLIRFRARAPGNPGNLTFTVTAESTGLRTAQHVVEMEVRSTTIPVTRSVFSLVMPGESWSGNLEYPGRVGTNTLTASFSRLPPINLEARLDFLVRYPHGCLEQTVSRVFPQLYLDRILDLNAEQLAQIRTNINAGIERIAAFQLPSGGFAFWPNGMDPHDWGTSYAGHFLLEARRAGFAVPEHVISRWLHFQMDRAALWQVRNERFTEQAYRLYTIALAGQADLGSMNRLRDHANVPLQARWRLAAAYWLAGQREAARNMVRDLPLPGYAPRELSGTFGSPLRDRAMALETLMLIHGQPGIVPMQSPVQADADRIRALFEDIAHALSSDRWLSTQETSFALIAIAPFMRNTAGNEHLTVEYSIAGTSESITFVTPMTERSLGYVAGTASAFSVTNRSASPVYVKFTSRGLPEEGSEPALTEGLELQVAYLNMAGQAVNPDTMNLGEDMQVRLTVRNTTARTVEEIALVVPIPASWEIINTRLADDGTAPTQTDYTFQDIRDDRVLTYFDLRPGQAITVTFLVHITYDGNFFRPAIHAYAMYDESIRGLIPGLRR